MYSNQTNNYGLPQWQPNDKPTYLSDFNEAFAKIDAQMKINHDLAKSGGVPQSLIDQVNQNTLNLSNIATQIGIDVITTIGTSITNAIVNLKNAIDTISTNLSNITTQIGTDVITTIGTSITNAIVNLKNAIDTISTNLSNITTQIGTDAITTIGTSITNAIVNLNGKVNINIISNTPIETNMLINNKRVMCYRTEFTGTAETTYKIISIGELGENKKVIKMEGVIEYTNRAVTYTLPLYVSENEYFKIVYNKQTEEVGIECKSSETKQIVGSINVYYVSKT